MAVNIKYRNINTKAKLNFTPTTDDSLFPNCVDDLRIDYAFQNYQNPCEPYSLILDGESTLLPETVVTEVIGLISDDLSTNNGQLNVQLTLTSTEQYSSSGFTFTFDVYNQIYPTEIYIRWYANNELIELDDADENGGILFTPDNAEYFCEQYVGDFDKVIIDFIDINMPNKRLHLCGIDFGYVVDIPSQEIREVKIIQQIEPLGTALIANAANITLDTTRDYIQQLSYMQPLDIYKDGQIVNRLYIVSVDSVNSTIVNLKAEDYILYLDTVQYSGWYQETEGISTVIDVLDDIFDTAGISYTIPEDIGNISISGFIPATSCRNALLQVLFYLGAYCDTSDVYTMNIYRIDLQHISQHIDMNRILVGQKFKNYIPVTSVKGTSYDYLTSYDIERSDLYKATQDGIGIRTIYFDSPVYDLDYNRNYGEILEYNSAYATLNITDSRFVLAGVYRVEITNTVMKSRELSFGEQVKEMSLPAIKIVNQNTIDNLINTLFDYYSVKSDIVTMQIKDGVESVENLPMYDIAQYDIDRYDNSYKYVSQKKTKVGDVISFDTIYGDVRKGIITKQTFSLRGNIIWKDTEVSRCQIL